MSPRVNKREIGEADGEEQTDSGYRSDLMAWKRGLRGNSGWGSGCLNSPEAMLNGVELFSRALPLTRKGVALDGV